MSQHLKKSYFIESVDNLKSNNSRYRLRRLCYVVMVFPQITETFITEEAQSLKNFGVDVLILALNKGKPNLVHSSAQEFIDRHQVKYIKNRHRLDLILSLCQIIFKTPISALYTLLTAFKKKDWRWRYFQAVPYALELINNNTDYIHAHFADENLRFASILSKWTGIPFGFTIHGYDVREDPLSIQEFFSLSQQASAIVTVSDHYKRLIVEKYHLRPEQIYVAYNGIRTELFQSSRKTSERSAIRIINVGRLAPIKGQDILLEALNLVREQGVEVKLWIIGDGPLRHDLESHAQRLNLLDRVEFIGAQSQDQICHYLSESDIFVMPSRSESFGVACIEAMAMELPVIASAAGGLPEIVLDKQTGLLCLPENPESLAEAIVWMTQHPEQRLKMGKKGRETVLAKFTREKVTEGLMTYWQKSIFYD